MVKEKKCVSIIIYVVGILKNSISCKCNVENSPVQPN